MRKSVKRSLFLWPLIASATLSAGSAIDSLNVVDRINGQLIDTHETSQLAGWATACTHSVRGWFDLPPREEDLELESRIPLGDVVAASQTESFRYRVAKTHTAAGKHQAASHHRGAGHSPGPGHANEHPIASRREAPLCTIELLSRDSGGQRGLEMPSRLAKAWKIGEPFMPPTETVAPPKIEIPIELPLANQWLKGGSTVPSVLVYPQNSLAGDSPSVMSFGADASHFTDRVEVPAGIREVPSTIPPRPFPLGPFRVTAVRQSQELRLPETTRVLAKPIVDATASIPVIRIAKVDAPKRSKRVTLDVWPSTPALDAMLRELSDSTSAASSDSMAASRWASEVSRELAELQHLDRLAAPQAGMILDRLTALTGEGNLLAEGVADRELRITWLRTIHALNRRTAIWKSVHTVAASQTEFSLPSVYPNAVGSETTQRQPTLVFPLVYGTGNGDHGQPNGSNAADSEVRETVSQVRALMEPSGDVAGWTKYLLLDEISGATEHCTSGSANRLTIAQRFLSRLHWHGLTIDAQEFLATSAIQRLGDQMRPWAGGAIDYVKLLQQIEKKESDTIDLASMEIADAIMTLRHASDEKAVDVARALTTHYQNANVRFAISEDMLNRMIPKIDAQTVPLRTSILGSRVRGVSTVQSDLRLALIPNRNRWMVQLKTLGQVSTQSVSRRDGVAIRTAGDSRFNAGKPIEISRDGIRAGESFVEAGGNTRLRGIKTKYDSWPLVGSLVQAIAGDKFTEMRPISQRIADGRVRTQVQEELDTRVSEKVAQASNQMSQLLLGPFGRMSLEPHVVDMNTTTDRMTARFRLAGDWQTSAFTPRPRAVRGNLMSVQVHQSAINNTLEQLIPRDKALSLEELVTRSTAAFGQAAELPADLPEDVRIQFASTRPISVEVRDDRVWITMRVQSLSRESGKALTKFLVRSAYRPQVDGLNAGLVRDGHLRISGPGMSMGERLPLRAIFNKVLAESRTLPLTMPALTQDPRAEGLAISQLELRDGWIALAVSESDAPRLAIQGTSENR